MQHFFCISINSQILITWCPALFLHSLPVVWFEAVYSVCACIVMCITLCSCACLSVLCLWLGGWHSSLLVLQTWWTSTSSPPCACCTTSSPSTSLPPVRPRLCTNSSRPPLSLSSSFLLSIPGDVRRTGSSDVHLFSRTHDKALHLLDLWTSHRLNIVAGKRWVSTRTDQKWKQMSLPLILSGCYYFIIPLILPLETRIWYAFLRDNAFYKCIHCFHIGLPNKTHCRIWKLLYDRHVVTLGNNYIKTAPLCGLVDG